MLGKAKTSSRVKADLELLGNVCVRERGRGCALVHLRTTRRQLSTAASHVFTEQLNHMPANHSATRGHMPVSYAFFVALD